MKCSGDNRHGDDQKPSGQWSGKQLAGALFYCHQKQAHDQTYRRVEGPGVTDISGPPFQTACQREYGEECHRQPERCQPERDQETTSSSSIFSETPASAKVVISERHFAAASTICIARAAPEPSPKRICKSSNGSKPI